MNDNDKEPTIKELKAYAKREGITYKELLEMRADNQAEADINSCKYVGKCYNCNYEMECFKLLKTCPKCGCPVIKEGVLK